MKGKKVLSVFLLAGILAVTVATTAFAAPGTFTHSDFANKFTISLTNNTNTDRYSLLLLDAYDNNWMPTKTIGSSFKVLGKSGGSNKIIKESTALHVKGSGTIYKGNVAQSGVDETYSYTFR